MVTVIYNQIFRCLFFELWCVTEKHGSRQFLNAIEREVVPNRVLNPKACGVQGRSPGGRCGKVKAHSQFFPIEKINVNKYFGKIFDNIFKKNPS